MGGNAEIIKNNEFLEGKLLIEAIFVYGSRHLIEKYSELTDFQAPELNNASVSGILLGLANSLQDIERNKLQRDKLVTELKKEILELIKKGDLIAFGFINPRNLNDNPIKIPIDLFFTGQINWDNSELIDKQFKFTGIRILKSNNIQINNEFKDIKNNDSSSINPSKKLFSDLDPQLHIDEHKTAEILGISVRTLQGYRSKGGGPEFRKIGKKIVRYKIEDLIIWSENNKKNNTSNV